MRSSREWLEYYQANAGGLLPIDWEIGPELTAVEQKAIKKSIQGFQVGESSEGHHLMRYAKEYAARSGDSEYLETIKLFIREEQRHARDLARFMEMNDIPTIKKTFPDRVFRRLRQTMGGLEISIAVLITAEIIAKIYYLALQRATQSKVLRQLCEQILRDEVKHVEFQSEQLGKLRWRRHWILRAIAMGAQRFLFAGTCCVVWMFHRKAFLKGGFGFLQFWRGSWAEFELAFSITANTVAELRAVENAYGSEPSRAVVQANLATQNATAQNATAR